MRILILTSFLILIFLKIFGQPLHIVPIHMTNIDNEDILLSIKSDTSIEFTYTIQDNTFYLNFNNGMSDIFPLGNRTIQDLCSAVNVKYPSKIILSSNFPFIEATRIEITEKSIKLEKGLIGELKPAEIKPTINLDFGLLLSLAQTNNGVNNSSLLTQTGFNIDIIGQHKFILSKNKEKYMEEKAKVENEKANEKDEKKIKKHEEKIAKLDLKINSKNKNKDELYAALRLGFASNLNLVVNDSTGTQNTSGQIESAIQQANQAVMSAHLEYMPNCLKNDQFQCGFYTEFGLTYAKLQPLDPTTRKVLYNGEYFNIADTFSMSAIENFKNESIKVFPIGYVEAGFNFRFVKDNSLIFYGGISNIWRPNIQRGFRFTKTKDGKIEPEILDYITNDKGTTCNLRPKIGLRLANVVDIRAEAIYAFDWWSGSDNSGIKRLDTNNLFRIFITRDFPIKNK